MIGSLTNTQRIDRCQSISNFVRRYIDDMDKHERLKRARIAAGIDSAASGARLVGTKIPTYTHHENGTRDFSDSEALLYARRFKVPVEWLVFGVEDGKPMSTAMPVRGEVRAGAWFEIEGENERKPEFIAALPDPKYPASAQYALRVVGDSMNKVVQSGQYIVVVSLEDAGIDIRDSDLVVVKRERAMTYEVTLKRAKMGPNGWELWPESTDPRHQEPIILGDGDRDVEVSVIARVLGRYEKLGN
jgi:SOS-response transcriptional repressor LexA